MLFSLSLMTDRQMEKFFFSTNDVLAFSIVTVMFLHLSVSHSVHRGVSDTNLGKLPPGSLPFGQTTPPGGSNNRLELPFGVGISYGS